MISTGAAASTSSPFALLPGPRDRPRRGRLGRRARGMEPARPTSGPPLWCLRDQRRTTSSAAVDFARANGLRVAAAGRPGTPPPRWRSSSDTLLVKTMRMGGVEVDPVARRARVEAGVLWGDLAVAAGEYGLAGLAGSSPDVGVVGYSLGGGIGWLSRRHGLAANSITAIELVTAEGELVRADRDHEADLFWALRGGGGSFGVVTALEMSLVGWRRSTRAA